MHKKPGFILFLLFGILTLCMTLITLFMAKTISYQHLMHLLTRKNKTSELALHATALGQSLLYVDPNKDKKSEEKDATKNAKDNFQSQYDQKLFKQIFKHLNKNIEYKLKEDLDSIDAVLELYLGSEDGKLNINSVYNFAEKKFINEGQNGDRKKFCQWMFEAISKKTQKPSLFEPFEKHLKQRDIDFNDVTELLQIKEFNLVFEDLIFYNPHDKSKENLYLTDLFTVTTEEETINPWFFSHSWRVLLNLKSKIDLPEDDTKKLIQAFKKEANWEKDWANSLRLLYQKEYKDIPTEIKTMLTTDCEANIFSLLLNVTIGETTSTIFTILKKQPAGKTATFDIVKIYQI